MRALEVRVTGCGAKTIWGQAEAILGRLRHCQVTEQEVVSLST